MSNKTVFLMVFLICTALIPAYGKGFFEVLYAQKAIQEEDFKVLDDASTMGFAFGYDTEIAGSGVFLDIELGYEVSEHELPASTSAFKSHRGFLGLRVKYGGFGYVEPYIGFGVMAYAHYEDLDGVLEDFIIEKNLSGSYFLFGVDFFFSPDGAFYLGVEQRTMTFPVVGDVSKVELDAEVERLAFKVGFLF